MRSLLFMENEQNVVNELSPAMNESMMRITEKLFAMKNKQFISAKQAGTQWGISPRRIQILCSENRIDGAQKIGSVWIIPKDAKKPDPANKLLSFDDPADISDTLSQRQFLRKEVPGIVTAIVARGLPIPPRDAVLFVVESSVFKAIDIPFEWFLATYGGFSKISQLPDSDISFLKDLSHKLTFPTANPSSLINVISWAYEYLNDYIDNNRYQTTQFFTEEYMIQYLLSQTGSSGKVVDPCCGGGNFLAFALKNKTDSEKNLTEQSLFSDCNNLYGYDIDPKIAAVAFLNIVYTAFVISKKRGISLSNEDVKELHPHIFTSDENSFEGSLSSNLPIYGLLSKKVTTIQKAMGNADVILTNPPFMTVKGMPEDLKTFMKKHYPSCNCDLCSAFLNVCQSMIKPNGLVGIVTQDTWMFLDSLSDFRKKFLESTGIQYAVVLGSGAFKELNGEKSSVGLIVFSNHDFGPIKFANLSSLNYSAKTSKIRDLITSEKQSYSLLNKTDILGNESYRFDVNNVGKIKDFYYHSAKYADFATPMQGTSTGDSKKFVDYFWCHFGDPDWVLVSKGGGYSRFYGLNQYVVKWGKDGEFIKAQKGSAIRNPSNFSHTSMVFSDTGTSGLNVRLLLPREIFISSGPGIRDLSGNVFAHLAYLNSRIASYYMQMLSPKLTIAAGYIGKLPYSKLLSSSTVLSRQGEKAVSAKTSVLSSRPNQANYCNLSNQYKGLTLEKAAEKLLLSDLNAYLNQMEAEAEIDKNISQTCSFSVSDMRLIDSEMGPLPHSFKKDGFHMNIPSFDKMVSSLISADCLCSKTKINSIRYGADNLLEYLSRAFQINPVTLSELISNHLQEMPLTLEKYEKLLLHNAVLDTLGFSTGSGVAIASFNPHNISEKLAEIFSDSSFFLEDYIENTFQDTHDAIFYKKGFIVASHE